MRGVIPQLVTRGHILEAVRLIGLKGVPSRRVSRGYCLVWGGRHLPPKYAIALAHQIATGEFLGSDQFSGGSESNGFLQSRGFDVVECDCGCTRDDSARGEQGQAVPPKGGGSISGPVRRGSPPSGQAAPTLRAAMILPKLNGQQAVPSADSFAGEDIDFVLFPEAHIGLSDEGPTAQLGKLASDLGAQLLVGALDCDSDGEWNILLRFDPDGSMTHIYTKHSTADAVAFGVRGWNPRDWLPTFELGGVRAGATICHDSYLGLLQRRLAKGGARIWVNPSYNDVVDIKWASVLRLRAVENRFFALCTLNSGRGRTHPFAFSPDGRELRARKAGCRDSRPMSECTEAGAVYVVDLDVSLTGKPLSWPNLPRAGKPKLPRSGKPRKPVRIALRDGRPAVYGTSGWSAGGTVSTAHGRVHVGVVPSGRILDAASCFSVIDRAKREGCRPIIWNLWESLPTSPERLAALMMGRAIECCSPVVISDRTNIHELVELSNRNKIPARRTIEPSGEAVVDAGYAWGLPNAFNMVTGCLSSDSGAALDRYRSLASG